MPTSTRPEIPRLAPIQPGRGRILGCQVFPSACFFSKFQVFLALSFGKLILWFGSVNFTAKPKSIFVVANLAGAFVGFARFSGVKEEISLTVFFNPKCTGLSMVGKNRHSGNRVSH
jgi:hypothetical protein